MSKSKTRTFCPHCASIVPAGQECACRKRKRRATANDATRGEREPWRGAYDDPEYRRNRQVAIARQRGRCKDCGKACAEYDGERWRTKPYGGEVDHEVPLCEGGTNDPANLALRCKGCHSRADARRRKSRR